MSHLPEANVVWLKRDLRARDHAPLHAAAAKGIPIVLLYIFDPALIAAPDSDVRHWRFVWQSLCDLQAQLKPYNAAVMVMHEDSLHAFQMLQSHVQIKGVFSHQETGNDISFDRDKKLSQYFKEHSIPWREFQCNGVIRGLKNRATWDEAWRNFMIQPPCDVDLQSVQFLKLDAFPLIPASIPDEWMEEAKAFQPGGEVYAWKYLLSFLHGRHNTYSSHISKPLLSRKSCSRLSPYLAYGNLSMRQVYQMTLVQMSQSSYKR